MRGALFLASLGLLLLSSCTARSSAVQRPVLLLESPSRCDEQDPLALIVGRHGNKLKPKGHTVLAPSTLKFIEARYVEGPCADDIVKYVSANGTLASGQIFAISSEGKVEVHPSQGLSTPYDLPAPNIEGLAGYRLVMVERVRLRRTAEGDRASFIGLFRRRTDSVIARFDVVNGKPSREAEVLIRSGLPIDSIDFLGAPDWPAGWIGVVEQAGKGEAWLYSYRWNHGDLPELKF